MNNENTNVNEQAPVAPVSKKTGPLSPEEKARREATRLANEEKLKTVWPQAKEVFMERMGMKGMEMNEQLETAVTSELKKIARAILKPESARNAGRPKIERDTERLEQQLIKSFEFATRNNLMEAKEGEDSPFVKLLTKVMIEGDLSGKIVKEAKKDNAEGQEQVESQEQTREQNFG